jgi:hypothetical protein
MKQKKPPSLPEVVDEPGMPERFQRGLQRAFQMPHKPITPKSKERPASKGCVHQAEGDHLTQDVGSGSASGVRRPNKQG